MRWVNRHTGKARLFEVEDSSAGNLLEESHPITRRFGPGTAR
jgi:hypothetical protein